MYSVHSAADDPSLRQIVVRLHQLCLSAFLRQSAAHSSKSALFEHVRRTRAARVLCPFPSAFEGCLTLERRPDIGVKASQATELRAKCSNAGYAPFILLRFSFHSKQYQEDIAFLILCRKKSSFFRITFRVNIWL